MLGQAARITICRLRQNRDASARGLYDLGRASGLGGPILARRCHALDAPLDVDLPLLFEAAGEHHLQGPAWPALIGEEHALLERDGRRVGADGPSFAIRE